MSLTLFNVFLWLTPQGMLFIKHPFLSSAPGISAGGNEWEEDKPLLQNSSPIKKN